MSKSWLDMVQDIRPQRGGWAPGGYICNCSQCGEDFIGDKRAVTCSSCAYEDSKNIAAMFGEATTDV